MLNAEKRQSLTEMMQNHFTDLDIERDEPFRFRSGEWMLVVDSVRLLEHDKFLIDMFELIMRYKQIFYNIDFLTAHNLADQNEIKRLVDQVMVFQANVQYTKFIRDCVKFISRWARVAKIRGEMVGAPKRSERRACKIVEDMKPDVFIYVLFLVFVRNYDIVKKNTLGFLQMFMPEGTSNTQTGTSSSTSKREVPAMPKFSPTPYPRSVLKIFEQQSKLR